MNFNNPDNTNVTKNPLTAQNLKFTIFDTVITINYILFFIVIITILRYLRLNQEMLEKTEQHLLDTRKIAYQYALHISPDEKNKFKVELEVLETKNRKLMGFLQQLKSVDIEMNNALFEQAQKLYESINQISKDARRSIEFHKRIEDYNRKVDCLVYDISKNEMLLKNSRGDGNTFLALGVTIKDQYAQKRLIEEEIEKVQMSYKHHEKSSAAIVDNHNKQQSKFTSDLNNTLQQKADIYAKAEIAFKKIDIISTTLSFPDSLQTFNRIKERVLNGDKSESLQTIRKRYEDKEPKTTYTSDTTIKLPSVPKQVPLSQKSPQNYGFVLKPNKPIISGSKTQPYEPTNSLGDIEQVGYILSDPKGINETVD